MLRRQFLLVGAGGALAAAGYAAGRSHNAGALVPDATASTKGDFEITRTETEWRTILSDQQFQVLRREATESPFSSPLNDEKRTGTYHCAGCELPVYPSVAKYDSATGWPSFFRSIPDAVRTKDDNSFFSTRTEVHCRRCGGHLGHIFDDGPEPTGKRHCLNGVALKFVST